MLHGTQLNKPRGQLNPISLQRPERMGGSSNHTEQVAKLVLEKPRTHFPWQMHLNNRSRSPGCRPPRLPQHIPTFVNYLGGRCRAALSPNTPKADFPRSPWCLTAQQASPLKMLTPASQNLNPCNLGLFLRCLQIWSWSWKPTWRCPGMTMPSGVGRCQCQTWKQKGPLPVGAPC